MFGFKEYLIERIAISSDIEDSLRSAIDKWIKLYSDDTETMQLDKIHWNDARTIGNALRKILQPTITKIIKQNLSQSIDDENFEGYKVKVNINLDNYVSSEHGSVGNNWRKLYTSGQKYIYAIDFDINLSFDEFKTLVKSANRTGSTYSTLLATITHELTHLIQLLRSKQGIKTKRPKQSHKLSSDQFYYMSLHELDAFAQGTVTKIINQAKTQSDPKHYIKSVVIPMLKLGMNMVFNREVFPVQSYNEIKKSLKELSSDPKIRQTQTKAWKYYNKKIYEKLMDAMGQFK